MKVQLRASLISVPDPHDLWEKASEIQEALTEKGQHRSASIADLAVATVASSAGLTVLHYNNDFDTIATFTEQPTRWVVPAGTV